MTTPVQSRRARRIPDQVWNNLREELVNAYFRDDVELKNMPKIIAEKHNLTITEVQLKDRFRKWQIKKNIPESALAAMSSMKRQRHALGKDARFKYNGFDVEPERLERALKRRKVNLPSSEFIPTSVELCVTPNQSPRMTWYTVKSPIISSQRTENPITDWRTFNSIFPGIGEDLPDRACVAPSQQHASVNIAPYRAISNETTTIALQPRSPDLAIDGSLANCINVEDLQPVPGEIGTDWLLYDNLVQEDPQLHSRASSVKSPNGDWLRLIDWSPAPESHARIPEPSLKASCDVHTGNPGSIGEPVVGVQVASSTSIHGNPIGSLALSVSLSNEEDFTFIDLEQMFMKL